MIKRHREDRHFLISISQWNEKDIIGEKITFCVREMLSNKQEYDAILTDLDLTQISATPKTITPTQIWGGGGTNYNEMENNFQALKTTGILCSPIAEVDITAMGYVDGKLHIQVKYEDSLETDNHGYIYFKNDKGEDKPYTRDSLSEYRLTTESCYDDPNNPVADQKYEVGEPNWND